MSPTNRRNSQDTSANNNHSASRDLSFDPENGPWPCSYPQGCLFNNGSNSEHIQISSEDLFDSVRVKCSNEQCKQSPYMHSSCFESFEELALQHLKASGRAKSWSERQRVQNVWTKRGYDLVYKACDCLCGHGHLRKDLDWTPPPAPAGEGGVGGEGADEGSNGTKRKRKKSKSQNVKPSLSFGLSNMNCNSQFQNNNIHRSDAQNVPNRNRNNSICSNGSGGSGSLSSSSASYSPGDRNGNSAVIPGSGATASDGMMLMMGAESPNGQENGFHPQRRATALLQERTRHDSGGSIFQRRLDYSSFNVLPKHKINSYHIKMEDECSIGNDETRIFILSSFASNKMSKAPCVVCNQILTIYDRYPLLDGTFFLSPRQHNKGCIQVKFEGKYHYLSSVCMGCLEGWTKKIHCRYCLKPWTGSHLILGTMYSYDIFAAMPCCAEKLKCNNCSQLVIHPDQRFNFFSDYSQMVSCPNCGVQESHFCKSLQLFVSREEAQKIAQQQHQLGSGMRVHRVNSA